MQPGLQRKEIDKIADTAALVVESMHLSATPAVVRSMVDENMHLSVILVPVGPLHFVAESIHLQSAEVALDRSVAESMQNLFGIQVVVGLHLVAESMRWSVIQFGVEQLRSLLGTGSTRLERSRPRRRLLDRRPWIEQWR